MTCPEKNKQTHKSRLFSNVFFAALGQSKISRLSCCRYSKQAFLSDVQHPYQLPDKSPSFKDFMGNKNNRFINPAMASKNRIQPPSKVNRPLATFSSRHSARGTVYLYAFFLGQILHFFNTPPSLTEEQLREVFEKADVGEPKTIKLFPSKSMQI